MEKIWYLVLFLEISFSLGHVAAGTIATHMNDLGGEIVIDDSGTIICEGIHCPNNTKKCVVRKHSIPGTELMTVEKSCVDSEGIWSFDLRKNLLV